MERPLRILYISQYYYPEMGAASARVHELAGYWSVMGHSVTVLTCFPNYPDGVIYPEYKRKLKSLTLREEINGVDVVRTFAYPTHLRSFIRRALNYISFFVTSTMMALFLDNFDVIIATSPPLLVGLSGFLISRIKGCPLVFEVRDLWPEVMSAVSVSAENSISYRTFDKLASFLYDKCTFIVALSNSFKDEIISKRSIDTAKIIVIENAVDIDFFKPSLLSQKEIDKLGFRGKFIVSYIGTIGYTHGVEVILQAARKLKYKFPQLVFLLVGDGSDKERLEKLSKMEGLDNVVFAGIQPKIKIPTYINASEISLVLSSKEPFFQKTLFAKVFEPMACGKPIIVGASGETRDIVVEKANAGIDFEPENPEGLIDSITKLHDNHQLRKELGKNGREFVVSNFSRMKKAEEYIALLELVSKRK